MTNQLEGLTLAVINLMNLSAIKRQYLRVRKCQYDWRVGRNDELDVVIVIQEIVQQH